MSTVSLSVLIISNFWDSHFNISLHWFVSNVLKYSLIKESYYFCFSHTSQKQGNSQGAFHFTQNFQFTWLKSKWNVQIKRTFSRTKGQPSEAFHLSIPTSRNGNYHFIWRGAWQKAQSDFWSVARFSKVPNCLVFTCGTKGEFDLTSKVTWGLIPQTPSFAQNYHFHCCLEFLHHYAT